MGFNTRPSFQSKLFGATKPQPYHPVSWPQGTEASPGAMVVQRGNHKDPGRSLFLSSVLDIPMSYML